ncbi:hypothetical protein COLO4_08255 [Corchorus olitorius]|uniref:Uncharacterized protein n=1 Tax=Corchorus olitorius TaxID=93759 RepID=A0A1R3KGQ4_9ROSI|nr:hypothetical protein COLO4_08255 [Corchorus olitorius]
MGKQNPKVENIAISNKNFQICDLRLSLRRED